MYLLTKQIARLFKLTGDDVAERTIDDWCRKGIIRPTVSGTGRGSMRLFSFIDVLALWTAKGLRANGFDLSASGKVAEFIQKHSEAELKEAFSEGRELLIVVGGSIHPDLVTAEVAHGEKMRALALEAAQSGGAISTVNVKVANDLLRKGIDKMQAADRKVSKRRGVPA